ncbi:MAG: hypothetical protein AAF170_09515 [Bacteroidota bacterium]
MGLLRGLILSLALTSLGAAHDQVGRPFFCLSRQLERTPRAGGRFWHHVG